jgi:hypothetical protein
MAAGVELDGLVESLHAAANVVTSAHHMVLPRTAAIREIIAVSALLGVVNDCRTFISYNTRAARYPIAHKHAVPLPGVVILSAAKDPHRPDRGLSTGSLRILRLTAQDDKSADASG